MKSSHIAPYRGRRVCMYDYVCMSVTTGVCLCVGVWFYMYVWVHVCGCVNVWLCMNVCVSLYDFVCMVVWFCMCMVVWLCVCIVVWFCVCACEVSEKGEDSSFKNLHEMHLGYWIEWALVVRQDHRRNPRFLFDPSVLLFWSFCSLWISESTPELSDFEVDI